jgi:type IV pilus assembly protein PilN
MPPAETANSVAFVTANYHLHRSVERRLADTNGRVEMVRSRIAQLDKQIAAGTPNVQERKAIEEKLAVLDGWRKKTLRSVNMLDELSTLIPSRVWLSDYSESAGAVTMRGYAVAYDDLSSFHHKLHGSADFRDLTITDVQQSQSGTRARWEMKARFPPY